MNQVCILDLPLDFLDSLRVHFSKLALSEQFCIVNSKSLLSSVPLAVHGSFHNMQLPLIDFILGIARLVIQKICKRDHHGGGESPSEATRASVVIHQLKHFFGSTSEQLGVHGQDLLDLFPFNYNFISISLSLLLELIVTHPLKLLTLPKAGQVGLIHHVYVRPPE